MTYSRSERIGFILLISFILILVVLWRLKPLLQTAPTIENETELNAEWAEYSEKHISENDSYYDNKSNNNEFRSDDYLKSIAYSPKSFDPNSATIETMIASGVPINSAKRIIKYRNKGGTFYNKEKLRNFGMNDDEYDKVAQYISIKKKQPSYYNSYNNDYSRNGYKKYDNTPQQEPTNLNINTATSGDLQLFKGIGPAYAGRIINFRNKLGGFISINQIGETYGLPDSVFDKIKDKLVVDIKDVQKIPINTATLEDLEAHPYTKYLAKNIIQLRNSLGGFKKITDLKQVPLINEEKYRKIVPYIILE